MKCYIVDAFTDKVFKGNPAAVCVMDQWLPDRLMQDITRENNLSETAFTVLNVDVYDLRWFTPGGEIDLCGHARLATAIRPIEAWLGRDMVCILENEEQVRQAAPNEEKLKKLDGLFLQLTAKGKEYDCITRSFAPKLNVFEDPVCGSGDCHVIPLWADKLHKNDLCAFQASHRTGVLYCHREKSRVLIAGKATLYSIAELYLPENE